MCSDHEEDIGGDSGINEEYKAILERVRLSTRQDYLQGAASGSVRATDRLMRELQDIYRSQNFKDGGLTLPAVCNYSYCNTFTAIRTLLSGAD